MRVLIKHVFLSVVIMLSIVRSEVVAETWEELRDKAESLSIHELLPDSAFVLGTMALEQARSEFGEDTTVAYILFLLGIYKYESTDYDSSLLYYQQALSLQEKLLGKSHEDVTSTLQNMGNTYKALGMFPEAISVFEQSMDIMRRNNRDTTFNYANVLANLASVKYETGDFSESESLGLSALSMFEAIDPKSREVATVKNDLANLYRDERRFSEAERLYHEALSLNEARLHPNHPRIAKNLDDLACCHRELGRYEEARPLFERALAIWEANGGDENANTAVTSFNYANLCGDVGDYERAEELYKRSLHIEQGVYGPDHPEPAWTQVLLSGVCLAQERWVEADSVLQIGFGILERTLDPYHQDIAAALGHVTAYHRVVGNAAGALAASERALNIWIKNVQELSPVLPEAAALAYADGMREAAGLYLTCYIDAHRSDTGIQRRLADLILASKGQISDEMFARHRELVDETDPGIVALADSLRDVKYDLAGFLMTKPDEDTAWYREAVAYLQDLARRVESELARRSASFRAKQNFKQISSGRIASLLPRSGTLVEFVQYEYWPQESRSSQPRYLAIVLRKDTSPAVIDLGKAATIDSLVSRYRNHMLMVASRSGLPTGRDKTEYVQISADLYERIWEPIAPLISRDSLVIIAPDGSLNLISFAGLSDPDGKYLVESHLIHSLLSGRDMIRFKDRTAEGRGLLAMADPDYDAPYRDRMAAPDQPPSVSAGDIVAANNRYARFTWDSLHSIHVSPLPGTRNEISRIEEIWKDAHTSGLDIFLGAQASEDNFGLYAPGKFGIHLATHGYFIEDTERAEDIRTDGGPSRNPEENPLLLSGVLLAGANLHGRGADSLGIGDGFLTAQEVSDMDLEGVRLVVLSACESGLGRVERGEGVYGLRRAFQMAGARTVVSALWPVNDKITADMMSVLYGQADASFPVRIRTMQIETISRLRGAGLVDHPYFWAGFIALGDWR